MNEEKKETVNSATTAGVAVSGITGLLAAALGAGWPGVLALALLGAAMPFVWSMIVGRVNKSTDSRDLNAAGTDVAKTALDLQTQGREVSRSLDQAQAENPPTDGFTKN